MHACRCIHLLSLEQYAAVTTKMARSLQSLAVGSLPQLAADGLDRGDPQVVSHRNALQVYVFFLSCILDKARVQQAQADKQSAAAAAAAGACV